MRRACHAAQLAVAGDLATEDAAGLGAAIDGIPERVAAVAAADLAEARSALATRDFYAAWRCLRRMIAVEDALLADTAPADAG